MHKKYRLKKQLSPSQTQRRLEALEQELRRLHHLKDLKEFETFENNLFANRFISPERKITLWQSEYKARFS